jgi:hypothetical protein
MTWKGPFYSQFHFCAVKENSVPLKRAVFPPIMPIDLYKAPFSHSLPSMSVTTVQLAYITEVIPHFAHFNPEDGSSIMFL